MLDFTSSLYLGFWHGSGSIRPWAQLTTGVPAALAEPPGAAAVAQALAHLQGSERATLASSSLHLFWDVFGLLADTFRRGEASPSSLARQRFGGDASPLRRDVALYVDVGAYPIARWGVECAARKGVPARRFAHGDPDALRRAIERAPGERRPVVVCDGVCVCCGGQAPLAAYLAVAREYGGLLVVDDTQGLGLMGRSPGPDAPYGRGGGGSLRRAGVTGPDVLVVSSLAKGFGVPMAALSGSRRMVEWFEANSLTRAHCSPPSIAEIHAAVRALSINARRGDALRAQLAERVRTFRGKLAEVGLAADGGLFPVQTLKPMAGVDARELHRRLAEQGIRAVLRSGCNGGQARISFIITARHRPDDLERAAMAVAQAIRAGELDLEPG